MTDFDHPIRNLEDAKAYFQAMGCSHFHMGREYPERYREYRSVGVSKDLEKKWREESLEQLLAQASFPDTDAEDLWLIHSRMADLACSLRTMASLESIHETTVQMEESLPALGKVIVAETINGRRDPKYRDGLIYLAYDLGRKDLATSFARLAIRLSKRARKWFNTDTARCCRALAKTRAICRQLKI